MVKIDSQEIRVILRDSAQITLKTGLAWGISRPSGPLGK